MPFDDKVKAAVLTGLLANESVRSLARKHGVSPSTIRIWRAQSGLVPPVIAPEKKEQLGTVVLEYIYETLRTLTVQVKHFRDPEWLKEQGAGTIYLVHGVLADKAIRLLAAIRENDPDADSS